VTYCVLADVRNLIPTLTIGAATMPTTVQAEAVIAMVENNIDLILTSRGWTLPVDDDATLAHLKTIASYGSAAAILKTKFPADDGPGSDSGAAGFWQTQYKEALDGLLAGTINLGDSGLDPNTVGSGFGVGDDTDPATAPYAWRDMEW